jgi:hypothetical protein
MSGVVKSKITNSVRETEILIICDKIYVQINIYDLYIYNISNGMAHAKNNVGLIEVSSS